MSCDSQAVKDAPVAASPPEEQQKRKRLPWSPTKNEDLIYELVKFGGKSQRDVASMVCVSQSTVSRIVQRYERWQAHAADREGGRLDPAERLRAQWWLTYERNERMIASSLRLAEEMQVMREAHKSVVTQPQAGVSAVRQEQTTLADLDRTGLAARFLRLAFKINMEQFKLTEREPPPMPEPLSAEEQAEHAAAAASDDEQCDGGRRQKKEDDARVAAILSGEVVPEPSGEFFDADEIIREAAEARAKIQAAEAENAEQQRGCGSECEPRQEVPQPVNAVVICGNHSHPSLTTTPTTSEDAGVMHPVHILHQDGDGKIAVKQEAASSCDENRAVGKNVAQLCINPACASARLPTSPANSKQQEVPAGYGSARKGASAKEGQNGRSRKQRLPRGEPVVASGRS